MYFLRSRGIGHKLSRSVLFITTLLGIGMAGLPAVYAHRMLSGTNAWASDYVLVADMPLGPPGFQDYLTYDQRAHRLYVSHVNRVTVVNTRTNAIVGSVGPFHDSHGIAIVDRLDKGYADSGADGVVDVFSLRDLKVRKVIKVSPDADGMMYDNDTNTVLVVAGASKNLTVINPLTDRIVRTISLPGKPEFLAVDGHGNAYVNISDYREIAKVGIQNGRVEATWPLHGCKDPHGLAYDGTTHRLFSGCANARLIVVNAENGDNLANLPIGPFSDSVKVDTRRHLVFSANEQTLTIIREAPDNHYSVVRTVPTFFGGRSMTLDPVSGRLFIAHGNMQLETSLKDFLKLRFGWNGVDVAEFDPAR